MSTKEKILYATLELASKRGLGNVSLGEIADLVGIKKASLYAHFSSRDNIIEELYVFLRERAKENQQKTNIDMFELFKEDADTILITIINNYINLNSEEHIKQFYNLIESEQPFNNNAAQILVDETNLMVNYCIGLMKLLNDYGKLKIKDTKVAGTIFAYTTHQMIQQNSMRLRLDVKDTKYKDEIYNFASGFVSLYK